MLYIDQDAVFTSVVESKFESAFYQRALADKGDGVAVFIIFDEYGASWKGLTSKGRQQGLTGHGELLAVADATPYEELLIDTTEITKK